MKSSNNYVFKKIYQKNLWGNSESKSGPGSTLEYTSNLRTKLQSLIEAFGITSILDAPCGDFNWMQNLAIANPKIEFIGGDIVRDLIKLNEAKFKNLRNCSFRQLDICNEILPKADLMIVRDCLFHLSEKIYLNLLTILTGLKLTFS